MATGKAETLFRSKAPGIMAQLLQDFAIWPDDAAAIVGNFGHECAGFTAMQEIKPVVAGSRGGYGWPMWTGPRRRAYEAYCARNHLDPASDKANYAYVFVELKGSEKHAITAVKAAVGLEAKVKAFELGFERAGAKHYASRNQWAKIALDAWQKAQKTKPAGKPASAQTPVQTPSDTGEAASAAPAPLPDSKSANPVIVEKPVVADPGELGTPPRKSKTVWTWALAGLGAIVSAAGDFMGGLDWRAQMFISVSIVGFAVYGIKRRNDLFKAVRALKDELG